MSGLVLFNSNNNKLLEFNSHHLATIILTQPLGLTSSLLHVVSNLLSSLSPNITGSCISLLLVIRPMRLLARKELAANTQGPDLRLENCSTSVSGQVKRCGHLGKYSSL
ncbi:hypothetical protein ACMFMF_003519 [Clarireedia jacksonii]